MKRIKFAEYFRIEPFVFDRLYFWNWVLVDLKGSSELLLVVKVGSLDAPDPV